MYEDNTCDGYNVENMLKHYNFGISTMELDDILKCFHKQYIKNKEEIDVHQKSINAMKLFIADAESKQKNKKVVKRFMKEFNDIIKEVEHAK